MNLTVLRYVQYDRVKPIYHLAEGDKFLLTAKIKPETMAGKVLTNTNFGPKFVTLQKYDKDEGLWYIRYLMNKKPMWVYTYKSYENKWRNHYEIKYETHLLNEKSKDNVANNKIFFNSFKESELKNYLVLFYE